MKELDLSYRLGFHSGLKGFIRFVGFWVGG